MSKVVVVVFEGDKMGIYSVYFVKLECFTEIL
jgi:hypothetical protein